MTKTDSVRVNSLRGNVGKHYIQWEIIKVQAIMVLQRILCLFSLMKYIKIYCKL